MSVMAMLRESAHLKSNRSPGGSTEIELESQYRPDEDFTLRTQGAPDVNDATSAANKGRVRVHENR